MTDTYDRTMVRDPRRRAPLVLFLAIIIPVGVLSRVVRTGSVLLDKYLGDALYAAMVYAIFRLWQESRAAAVCATVVMTVIELFQLTLIAAHMLESEHLVVRIIARLMGTYFSYSDLLSYAVAIGCAYVVDRLMRL